MTTSAGAVVLASVPMGADAFVYKGAETALLRRSTVVLSLSRRLWADKLVVVVTLVAYCSPRLLCGVPFGARRAVRPADPPPAHPLPLASGKALFCGCLSSGFRQASEAIRSQAQPC